MDKETLGVNWVIVNSPPKMVFKGAKPISHPHDDNMVIT